MVDTDDNVHVPSESALVQITIQLDKVVIDIRGIFGFPCSMKGRTLLIHKTTEGPIFFFFKKKGFPDV